MLVIYLTCLITGIIANSELWNETSQTGWKKSEMFMANYVAFVTLVYGILGTISEFIKLL